MGTRARLRLLAGISSLFVLSLSASRAERIISEGDTWRFHNGFTFPGATWNSTNYNDVTAGNWFSFPSGFGYGDSDDGTVLNDMQNGYAAFFTRKVFVIDNPAAINYLTLGVDYDDGFVAWINGVEVARRNVTSNTINQATLAAGNHEASRGDGASNPQEKEFIAVTNNLSTLLVSGTNVIAVSCHNVSLSSSDASLIVEVYTNITLVRGPFIQMPNSNQVTVVWRTDALTDSAVDYGLDLTYSGGTASDASLTNEHVINIPALLPGTNYYYRVRSGGVTLAQGDAFHTKRAANQPFRVVIFGDFGAGTSGMSNVAAQVNSVTNADLILTVGDNIYPEGQPGLFDPYWFSQYAPIMRRVPTFPALGNHDVGDGDYSGAAYLSNFYLPTNGPAGLIERNYSFDYGNAHFATFDSNPCTNPAINTATIAAIKTWLSNDLASTTKPWKFVYFHHPPYTSAGTHDDNEGVKTNIMPIVEAAGVQMVFNGHQHWYERLSAINGVYHITTGDGGQNLNAPPTARESTSMSLLWGVNGFTIVDIDDTKLTLTHITNGVPFDTFSLDRAFQINSQPTSQPACLGQPATLSVTASGTGPVSHQWRKRTWGSGNEWQLSTAINDAGKNGFFKGTSVLCGNMPGIDYSGRAFGLYANTSGQATALRNFPVMQPGDSCSLDYNNPRDMFGGTGTVAVFGLHDAGGTNRFELYFRAGDTQYTINDANTLLNSSGIPYTSGGLHIVFTLVTADTYNLSVTRLENSQTFTFSNRTLKGTVGSSISRVRLFYANNDTVGGSCRDFFVNNLSVGRRSDNASDPAYASGWSNGQNGGDTDLADGGSISGATTGTLTINPVSLGDAGGYNALVNTTYSPATVSSTATLSFNPVCVLITAPPDLSYTTNSTITVAGTASATSTVTSVSVNGFAATTGNLYSNWTATVSGLTGGTNTLIAVAADSLSHTATNTSRVIYADATFDGNSDGLPDAWQIQYFGSPFAPGAGPNVDGDNDGFSNAQEYLTGTDPNDGTSALRVTRVAGPDGAGFKIEWPAVSGKSYLIEYKNDWSDSTWAPLETILATGTGITNVVDGATGGVTKRFYRVRLQ